MNKGVIVGIGIAILGIFLIATNPAYALCAFDPENPFAPCVDTVGTLEYPKSPEQIIPAPLKQMNLGIKLGHIICDPDKYPVWNVHYKPACVYGDSEGELLKRGWAKLRLLLPAGPNPITELEVMGHNVYSLQILGNYRVGDEKYPLSDDRKKELAWEYSQQYHPEQTYLEYAITPHQNYYNVGDKIQFDLLEWGNYFECWNINLKIIDVKNNPVYEDNSVKFCLEPDGVNGTFHSYSMGEDFEEFVCERPGYYRIEISNGDVFSADILENFVCIDVKPEPIPVQESETTLPTQNCLGNARCFTGTVTQVIDGDTIKVDGKSIRFALASAPELHESGGPEARQFIDTICPVGSTALVDEDDGQTQGSYGRIIAEIYCNDYSLNSELLDAGLGGISFEFCDVSEFWDSSWAFKHGCFEKMPHEKSEYVQTQDCHPSYPDLCIPTLPPDLDCKDITQKNFRVLPPDPHRFDGDKDGIGCES